MVEVSGLGRGVDDGVEEDGVRFEAVLLDFGDEGEERVEMLLAGQGGYECGVCDDAWLVAFFDKCVENGMGFLWSPSFYQAVHQLGP